MIQQKGEFGGINWDFDFILLVYIADIRLWTCVYLLISVLGGKFNCASNGDSFKGSVAEKREV